MKNVRFYWAMGIAIVVLALCFAISSELVSKAPQQINITPRPPAVIEKGLTEKITKENAQLMGLLRQLQTTQVARVSALAMKARENFLSTYLATPSLTHDNVIHKDWPDVLKVLKGLVDDFGSFNIQSVQVNLKYVPYDKTAPPGQDIDMRAEIELMLEFGSNGRRGIIRLAGLTCHRRVCTWGDCDI